MFDNSMALSRGFFASVFGTQEHVFNIWERAFGFWSCVFSISDHVFGIWLHGGPKCEKYQGGSQLQIRINQKDDLYFSLLSAFGRLRTYTSQYCTFGENGALNIISNHTFGLAQTMAMVTTSIGHQDDGMVWYVLMMFS